MSDEPRSCFISSNEYSREITLLCDYTQISFHSEVYKPISLRAGMMIETTVPQFSTSLSDLDFDGKGKTFALFFFFFFRKFLSRFEMSVLQQCFVYLKLLLNLGREFNLGDFVKYTQNIGMCWNANDPISFKLGMMIDTTKGYILILVWVTLMFTQGLRFTRKPELVHSLIHSVVKWSDVAQRFAMVDDVREVTAKESCK